MYMGYNKQIKDKSHFDKSIDSPFDRLRVTVSGYTS